MSDPASDHARWLEWSRGLVTDFPRQTVAALFEAQAEARPEAPALWAGERMVTFGELNRLANGVARVLLGRSCAPGALIGLAAKRGVAFVSGALGILKAGGAYVPIDPEEPPARRRLREEACAMVLSAHDLEAAPVGENPPPVGDGEAAAYVLYTSGSTGAPKGVAAPHRAIVRLVCATDYLQLGPGDVMAFHSDLSFDASTLELWGPLLNGGSLVVTETTTVLSPSALQAHLTRYGITTLWLTTSLFNQMAAEAPGMFAGLRHLIFGGEAADANAVRRVLEHGRPGALINGYGPTETVTFAVCHRVEHAEDRIPIGRPIANTDAFILDAGLQPAAEGELFIGGPGVALGYIGQPEVTADRFLETPYGRLYRTGDLARWRVDGKIDYLGRADRQVKLRGYRIELGEIETILGQKAGIGRCVVDVKAAPSGEPILAAYYTGEVAPEALRAWAEEQLPTQMRPRALMRLAGIPLTANGKLDRAALPAPDLGEATTAATGAAPSTEAERQIAALWQEVLGLSDLSVDVNFFDAGGTSLRLAIVHSRLATSLKPDLKLSALFAHPTIRSLARHMDSGANTAAASVTVRNAAADRAERQRAAMARRRG